jgi:hypothetical protein
MSNYCLHVLSQESNQRLTVALSRSAIPDGSSLPTTNYNSWHQLQTSLKDVGITASLLQDAERTLMAAGFCTVTDIPLACGQLMTLGFGKIAEL